jgi:hypothetical protein
MTKSDQNSVPTPKFNIATDDEKCHKMRQLMLAEGGHGQEITELINALQRIGYFASFRVTDNEQLSSVTGPETQQRRLRTRRKARYRRIKKYYKSAKQYKKQRLRRKLCWLLTGKFKETEIAEMLGISVRTVIRDLNKIRPYYERLLRNYELTLKLERDRKLNELLATMSPTAQLKHLLARHERMLDVIRKMRKYRRHYQIIQLDLTQTDKYGIPKLTFIPKGRQTLAYPYKVRVHVIGSYEGRKFEADLGGFSITQTRGWM